MQGSVFILIYNNKRMYASLVLKLFLKIYIEDADTMFIKHTNTSCLLIKIQL